MDLILEKELEHQQKAVDSLRRVFEHSAITKPTVPYANPTFNSKDIVIENNIKKLQKNVSVTQRGCNDMETHLNIDIKMETGTGKTYVYTQSIYELHKEYGFNKFIIVVPTLAIKAGVEQFMVEPYVKKHFADQCEYHCDIELSVLESPKKKNKGFLVMPSAVRDFVMGSCQNTKKIYVLLVNMQLLTSGKLLSRNDYDYLVEGHSRPFHALRETKPIVLIDEPHRFSRKQTAYITMVKELKPQAIIRFGATFPDITVGTGKNKVTNKDYNNLIYELNACDSFNKNLIKGINKEHFEPISKKQEKVKLVSIDSKLSATFHLKRASVENMVYTLAVEDSLAIIDPAFEGVDITAIGKNFVELSNGQVKYQGDTFNTDIYSSSYQEQMIKLALERHFETERQNFTARQHKIKTLALFFIDDIGSYRKTDTQDKEPYLANCFERLLLDKVNQLLEEIPEQEAYYREYLIATKRDIKACHAGYFAQDNSSSDELIAKEVHDILHNKKQLLSFYNPDRSFNTRRFLFSKWTLKEGWDNPNVFTIAKLRSSGSDISKLQEVGRGLRLPVNESGNRVSNEEFRLNYIVDFEEADFAEKLVKEINEELLNVFKILPEDIEHVAKKLAIDPDDLFIDLLVKKYINRSSEVLIENKEAFFAEYPDFAKGLDSNKVRDLNKRQQKKINIRKAQFDELKELWNTLNQKYYLFYDPDLNQDIPNVLENILKQGVFGEVVVGSKRSEVRVENGIMVAREGEGLQYFVKKEMKYHHFLKEISNKTSIPIQVIHNEIVTYAKSHEISNRNFNEYSATNIINAFKEWKINETQGRFQYKKSSQAVRETALTYYDGTPREQIVHGKIGTKFVEGTPSDKYLYDTIAFDSPLEKENILTSGISEIVVYGKIPRSSISIPTVVGETYSPDFMYVVKKNDGTKELNIVIETKLVENKSVLREVEATKINCAKLFFSQLKIDGYEVSFHTQLSNKKMKHILADVLE